MTTFGYFDSVVPVPREIALAHRREWERLARPGTWWSGAERVAIAGAARRAGRAEPSAVLPAAAAEVARCVAREASQLSREWYDEKRAQGLSDAQYVEIVGVVSNLVSIDTFNAGVGATPEALPEPLAGEPSRVRPDAARDSGAWVPMTDDPPTGNVIRALSLVPAQVEALHDLSAAHYLPMDRVSDLAAGRAVLDRRQIELVAARVSALNECFY